MRAVVLMGGILALAAGGSAAAGTVITVDRVVNGAPDKQQVIFLEPDRLRMSSPDFVTIYRGDQDKLWTLTLLSKIYVETTPETVRAGKAKMDQMMAQMRERLTNLPPEQRKQVESMMALRGAGPDPANPLETTYEKAGEPKKVGAWTCTLYHVTMSGGPVSDFCLAKMSDIGVTRDDLKAFVAYGRLMNQMAPAGTQHAPMAALDFDAMKKQIGFDDFPVQTMFGTPDGKHTIGTTLKSIQHQDPPADTFEVPAGFTRQDPTLGMGHPPG